ncbi:MAG TPA: glycosyl hydrolase family 28 protein [Vicinamibacterales bacterium]
MHATASRRDFLKLTGAAGLGLFVPVPAAAWSRRTATRFGDPRAVTDAWAEAASILARIVPPSFPARDFDVTSYGAVGDGTRDCTAAFRAAIAACNAAGGGRVVVPAGSFLTGAIRLKSGVNLHLATEASVLRFSRDPRQYLPLVFSRWEGVELMNYSALIYAFEERNIAVTGTGTLDGQAGEEHWWPWKGRQESTAGSPNQNAARARLIEMGAKGVPVADRVFGEGSCLRPNFVQPYRCQNVLIDGVKIRNSPMWEIHPVLCTNVTVRGVDISSHGPNNDGCDPESCKDVLIERCTFDTGDDCIAIKSGRNEDGRRVNVPAENIIVRDCTMKDGHGGVVIGSEISGGARYVFAERCRMDSPHLDRALRIKSNSVRGGTVEHVYMRDVNVGEVAEAVVTINFFYEEGDAGKFPPIVRDVEVRNVTSRKSQYGLLLRGYAHDPVSDVRLVDCTFDGVEKPDVLEAVKDIVLTNVKVNGTARNERITR